MVSYVHYEDYESITRSKLDSYWFDRMDTAIFGYNKARKFVKTESQLDFINQKFANLYLFMSVAEFRTLLPSYNWIITFKIMKKFRKTAHQLGINTKLSIPKQYSYKLKIFFKIQWCISYLVPLNYENYFKEQRLNSWGKLFEAEA